jgi:hypothetical protein
MTTMKTAETDVHDAAAKVVDMTLVQPSDIKDSDAHKAATLDREIRDGFRVVLNSTEHLQTLVMEAKSSQIHKVLTDPATGKSYKSWTAYVTDVVSSLGVTYKGIPKGTRHVVVGMLLNAGMTQNAIHKATGLALGTINADKKALVASGDVDPDVEAEALDGTASKGGRKPAAQNVEKTTTEKAAAQIGALSKLVDAMNPDELTDVKMMLSVVTKQIKERFKYAGK